MLHWSSAASTSRLTSVYRYFKGRLEGNTASGRVFPPPQYSPSLEEIEGWGTTRIRSRRFGSRRNQLGQTCRWALWVPHSTASRQLHLRTTSSGGFLRLRTCNAERFWPFSRCLMLGMV